MPTVTALQPQAGNSARTNVHLDGEFAMALSAGRAADWHVGQVLSGTQVELVRTAEAVDSGVKAVSFTSSPHLSTSIYQTLLPAVEV